MDFTKRFWVRVTLANLAIVALLGTILRSKMVFSMPAINYKNFLNAHSHYAFAGWAGLALCVLMIYTLLPQKSGSAVYRWLLAGIQLSAMGMLFTFPVQGYAGWSIFFSTLYILVTYAFAGVFTAHILRSGVSRTVKLLATGAMACLVISSVGPFGLAWILITKSAKSLLYRDFIYTYLHFQYNGFFTLAAFSVAFHFLRHYLQDLRKQLWRFSLFLVLSMIPALFLSLLWHGYPLYYLIGGAGCLLMLVSLGYFIPVLRSAAFYRGYTIRLARVLFIFAMLSYILKTVLNIGPLFPQLGHAVFADRPLIIGFLHLVFLGFITFYILSYYVETGVFSRGAGIRGMPVMVFSAGIILNQVLLMLQGLQILFRSNSYLYNRLLLVAAILLFTGAVMMTAASLRGAGKKP